MLVFLSIIARQLKFQQINTHRVSLEKSFCHLKPCAWLLNNSGKPEVEHLRANPNG